MFEMSYLVCDLCLVFAGWMDGRFGVANLFEDLTRRLEGTGIIVFNFGNFTTVGQINLANTSR